MWFPGILAIIIIELAATTTAALTNEWRSRTIYFALTDRVARSASDTGGYACGDLNDYCGGTFQGLESKLDYIQGMGFDALWISPVVANKPYGYHGYWAQSLYDINPNYGTADDLKSLVDSAHSKGMYVMVDVVANHMGQGSFSDNKPSPLDQNSSYHADCDIDYSNQTSVQECWLSGLPDIYTEKSEIRTLYQTWIKWLISEYSFDGMRIDTVKHVEKDFWIEFTSAAGIYSIGEAFDGDPAYVAGYDETMAGLINYPAFYPLNDFFQQKASAQALVDMHNTISNDFSDPTALGNFLDNHDNARFLSLKNDDSLLKNALAWVILSRGIPIVYYGTEQGFSGGADPANREDLWRSGFNTQGDLYQSIAKLNGARKSAGGLAGDDLVHLYVTNNAYAWSRAGGSLVVLTTNTGGGSSGSYCFNTQKANGAWSDVFGSGSYTSDSSGQVCVGVSNGAPVVLVAGGTSTTPTSTPTTLATAVTSCPTAVSVTFSETIATNYGDTIKIAGSTSQLGSWEASKALALSPSSYTSSNPVWTLTLSLPASQSFEYKFVRVTSSGAVTWESDSNRSYTVPACQASATVSSNWR